MPTATATVPQQKPNAGKAARASQTGSPTGDAKPFRAIPRDRGTPILGHALNYVKDPLAWVDRLRKRHGDVFATPFLNQWAVNLIGPDANEAVLLDRDKVFSNKEGWDWSMGAFFPRGLMLRDFDDHRRHRLIMQTAFTRDAMASYVDRMNGPIATAISEWGGPQKFYPRIKQLTLDLATDLFFGEKPGADRVKINKAFTDLVAAAGAWARFYVPGLKYAKGIEARQFLLRHYGDALPNRRAHEGGDMMSRLVHASGEDDQRLDDSEVLDHMVFLMMAAHDTTTITMSVLMYELAANPDWQERLREQSRAKAKPQLDYDDIKDMTGIELCMKEALRLVAPVPLQPRKLVRDAVVMGYEMPAGTTVHIHGAYTHHMPELWPESAKFDPERFSPERAEDKVHKFAFVPFGGGVHKCLGMHFADMQVKAIVHQLLLNYRWTVDGDYEFTMDYSTMPKPSGSLPMKFERL